MYGFIFGFQRRVWCPKWTPASSNSFIVTSTKRVFLLQSALALAELESGPGALLSVLLAFLLARVPGQEARRLQAVAQFGIELEQSTGNAEADRPGLARAASPQHRDGDVEL